MNVTINKVNSIAVFIVIFSDKIWVKLREFPNQIIEMEAAKIE